MKKQATDLGKPCNKVVVNYCYNIVQNYRGYLTGIDIAYSSDKDIDQVFEVLNYNDVKQEDSNYLQDALVYGCAYEIAYIDEWGKHRFKTLDPKNVIPIYDDTLDQDLVYCIRFWSNKIADKDFYIVEVYSQSDIKTYKSDMGFQTFELVKEEPHYFGMVPITVFELNNDRVSIFDQVMTLQDAYNNLLSSEVDDFQSFCDAYLVMKGVMGTDQEDLADMKRRRAIQIDSDADVSYLTKNISDTQIQNMLNNINDNIHKIANSPDFNSDKFMAQTGIAMRFKLVQFENASSAIEAEMRKALQRRIELICAIGNIKGDNLSFDDVKITFTRNLPTNLTETAQVVNSLRGLVSDQTLLSLLPFVEDSQAELDRLNQQKQMNMDMYSFTPGNDNTEEE